MTTKAGYVSIVGKPNAGKSTLINAILGTKLSIVTPKPQTTRKNILGIISSETSQVIFVDTPGFIKPRYELQKSMVNNIIESIQGTDLILILFDVSDRDNIDFFLSSELIEIIKVQKKPAFLLINKIDLLKNVKDVLPLIAEFSKSNLFKEIFPISALKKANIEDLLKSIEKYLTDSPFLFETDIISTQNDRFFASEIIRERVFMSYGDELPYSTEILINEFKEREKGKWYISADIIIERESQKKIIIGTKGEKIKAVGEIARQNIEQFIQHPVYLELFVKVRPKWRDNKSVLKSLGY
ncbi:MAG: GTPase Era [Ignavibacteria bacterium GWB2_35_12]|nr:MAG: GTPase Era [Ignavibacteria bacterium GWA2_35_8]OGU41102.1 MAG: GTPase Era [Ignavibacteria bacterium GWB2_35_12]OGU94723.1 MAG: GTPase Era [Ignavibacteria bacterium RIFOXYA2_FULL_35_10]OGV22918.1 MAG: GTPase Era [Ignavibacteria bacterium RIFOXYC2_FULL_35_21]